MRPVLKIDNKLLEPALAGPMSKAVPPRAAPMAQIQRESSLRLARMGGSEPDLQDLPRRRAEAA
jgi:hypothetical protein